MIELEMKIFGYVYGFGLVAFVATLMPLFLFESIRVRLKKEKKHDNPDYRIQA
jgi:hypothetical protein